VKLTPQRQIGIVVAVLFLATLALLINAMRGQSRVTCEVCVTFGGATRCREATGPNVEEATRTATENACGLLASGMTDSIRCSNTPPDSARCAP